MQEVWKTSAAALATFLVAAGLTGCDDATGPAGTGEGQTAVAFRTTSSTSSAPASSRRVARSIAVDGSNGTLELDEMYIVVEEFELKRATHDDCLEEDDACEKFEAPPAFVQLPLEGESAVAVSSAVAPDTYDELDFEIDDLDDDEPSTADLMAEIRADFPDWPKDGSLLVIGTFTPEGGSPIPFRVYFEAEVEIELALSPPVEITEDGNSTFTVELEPAAWFRDGTGGVRNLALLDYDATGQVAELEVEVEDGFTGIEFES